MVKYMQRQPWWLANCFLPASLVCDLMQVLPHSSIFSLSSISFFSFHLCFPILLLLHSPSCLLSSMYVSHVSYNTTPTHMHCLLLSLFLSRLLYCDKWSYIWSWFCNLTWSHLTFFRYLHQNYSNMLYLSLLPCPTMLYILLSSNSLAGPTCSS